MNYAHPEYMQHRWWLAAFAVLALALIVRQALAHRRAMDRGLAQRFGPGYSGLRAGIKLALWCAAAVYLLTALAVPQGPPVRKQQDALGADIILAVDVSSSMYANDMRPNRLVALKKALHSLLAKLRGDRVGLVAFAGEAIVACPLTSDYDTAALFLEKLETDSVPRDGTGLGPALRVALDGFSDPGRRGRIIVLATDGEDNQKSDAMTQAKRAADKGIPVYTLGIGTPQGALVPGRPDIFGRVMAKMYQGKPVRTKLDESTLKAIAAETGGRYFRGASEQAMVAAYQRVRELKQALTKGQEQVIREPRYQTPLLIAVALLLLEAFLSNRDGGMQRMGGLVAAWFRRRLQARRSKAGVSALWILAVLFPALTGFQFLDPGREAYDQGNAYYREGKFGEAEEAYQRSLEQKPRAKAWYNLGNARFQRRDFEGAAQAYQQTLELDPGDADAEHNLRLAQQKMQQDPQQGDQGGQEDQPQDQANRQKGQDQQGQQQQQSQGGGQSQSEPQQGQGQGTQQGQGSQNQGRQQNQQGQNSAQASRPGDPQNKAGDPDGELSQDQIHAIMNMVKNDQRRYQSAFEPLKKHGEQDRSPMDELLRRMSGLRVPEQESKGKGADLKEW